MLKEAKTDKRAGANSPPAIEGVLKQNYISDAVSANESEITEYMQSLGFDKINNAAFANGMYTVSDLHPRNVLKTKNGGIHVVDNIIRSNVNEDICL